MNLEVRFTPEAEDTYDAIKSQLLERWGLKTVLNLESKILKTLLRLSKSPDSYTIFDDETGVRRCVLHKNCSMIYKATDTAIIVICFWDNRQSPMF